MSTPPTTTAIWTSLSDDLRRFIRRRVRDEHDADDLLQETFARIHRRLDTVRDTDRLAAWVYRIARNVVHDHHRRAKRPTVNVELDPVDDGDDSSRTFRVQAAGWLEEMIRQLPEEYREALHLSEVEGLSQREVADRLGLSHSGAKSRVQRGRALLRGVLDRCCTFEFDARGNVTDCDPKPDRTVCLECEEPIRSP